MVCVADGVTSILGLAASRTPWRLEWLDFLFYVGFLLRLEELSPHHGCTYPNRLTRHRIVITVIVRSFL